MKFKIRSMMKALNDKATYLYCRTQCAATCRINAIRENCEGAEILAILGGCLIAVVAVIIVIKVVNAKGETMATSLLDKAQQKMEGALN